MLDAISQPQKLQTPGPESWDSQKYCANGTVLPNQPVGTGGDRSGETRQDLSRSKNRLSIMSELGNHMIITIDWRINFTSVSCVDRLAESRPKYLSSGIIEIKIYII